RDGATFGLVAPGYQMVRVLAGNLGGEALRFAPATTAARLKLLGVDVYSIGETSGDIQEWHRRPDAYRKVTIRSGCLVGAVAVGPWPAFDRVAQGVVEHEPVSSAKLRRFRTSGELWPAAASPSALAASAIVCSCMQVTRGQIDAARSHGCPNAHAVCRETHAASICGSCRRLVEDLVAL